MSRHHLCHTSQLFLTRQAFLCAPCNLHLSHSLHLHPNLCLFLLLHPTEKATTTWPDSCWTPMQRSMCPQGVRTTSHSPWRAGRVSCAFMWCCVVQGSLCLHCLSVCGLRYYISVALHVCLSVCCSAVCLSVCVAVCLSGAAVCLRVCRCLP